MSPENTPASLLDQKEQQLDNFFADLTDNQSKPAQVAKTQIKHRPAIMNKYLKHKITGKSPWWLWLLGLLLIAIVALYSTGTFGWLADQILGPNLKTQQPADVAPTPETLVSADAVVPPPPKPQPSKTANYLVQVAACLSKSCVNSIRTQLATNNVEGVIMNNFKKNQPIASLISVEVFKNPQSTLLNIKQSLPPQYKVSAQKVGKAFRILMVGFENPAQANIWINTLNTKHNLHFEKSTTLNSQSFIRISIGPFESRVEAQQSLADIKKTGFTQAFIISNL